MKNLHVIRDLLDKQIHDAEGHKLGRVDGIVVEVPTEGPPRVRQLEIGFVPLARRLSRRLEGFAMRMHKRLGVRRSAHFGIPWDKVTDVDIHAVCVDLIADETPAFDWERWLRRNVMSRLPGGTIEGSEDK